MSKLENVHDNFFKKVFSYKQNVRDFLKIALPESIKAEVDFKKISIDVTGYISDEIKGYFSDIVVKTGLKNKLNQDEDIEADIYILFEHKSYEDKKIFVQLLKYMYLMWQKDTDDKKPLRLIIPLVFYHGRRKWKIPLEFVDQFKVKNDLKKFLLNFKYILFDTNSWDFEDESNVDLRKNVHLLTSLLLMKGLYDKDYETIKKIFVFWREKGFISNREQLIFFLTYIVSTRDISQDKLVEILEESEIDGGDIMPTLAQRWTDEAYEKGIEKGIEKGKAIEKQEILIKFLEKKFDLKLKEEEKKLISGIEDVEKLENALEAILSVENKDIIMKMLK